jgi:hypothetical protein
MVCYKYYCWLYNYRLPSYGYAITLTKGINEKWFCFIENQGYKRFFIADATSWRRFPANKDMQIDASVSNEL